MTSTLPTNLDTQLVYVDRDQFATAEGIEDNSAELGHLNVTNFSKEIVSNPYESRNTNNYQIKSTFSFAGKPESEKDLKPVRESRK